MTEILREVRLLNPNLEPLCTYCEQWTKMTTTNITVNLPLGSVLEALGQMTDDQLGCVKRNIHHLQNRSSPFIRLPPELRTHIYSFVIEDHLRHLAIVDNRSFWCPKRTRHIVPILFNTCQQLRSEGLSLFLGNVKSLERFDRTTGKWTKLSSKEFCGLSLQQHREIHFDNYNNNDDMVRTTVQYWSAKNRKSYYMVYRPGKVESTHYYVFGC